MNKCFSSIPLDTGDEVDYTDILYGMNILAANIQEFMGSISKIISTMCWCILIFLEPKR